MKSSVIIPAYNIAAYIGETLDSVRAAAQHFGQAVECLCVDDGSTDGTAEILDRYLEETNRHPSTFNLRVIHQKNAGVSAARNAALDVASGEYICFVDGDDGVAIDYFYHLADVIERTHADIIRFSSIDVADLSAPIAQNETRREDVLNLDEERDAIRGFSSFVGTTWAWNACYRRDALRGLRFKKIPNGEDILFAAEAFMRVHCLCLTDRVLYKYRIRPGSAVHTISAKHLNSVCAMSKALAVSVQNWRWGVSVQKSLKRKLRNHLAGEVAARIAYLPKKDRDAVWESFFDALQLCAWSPIVGMIAKIRSKLWVRVVLVGDIRFRHFLSTLLQGVIK